MPYNFVADTFHTKKLFSRLSSSEVRFYTEIGRFAFLSPPVQAQTNNIRISNNSYLACLTGRRLVDQLAEAHMRGLSCSSFSSMIWK